MCVRTAFISACRRVPPRSPYLTASAPVACVDSYFSTESTNERIGTHLPGWIPSPLCFLLAVNLDAGLVSLATFQWKTAHTYVPVSNILICTKSSAPALTPVSSYSSLRAAAVTDSPASTFFPGIQYLSSFSSVKSTMLSYVTKTVTCVNSLVLLAG